MSGWRVFHTKAAAKELRQLDSPDQRLIAGAIELLAQHPCPPKAKKLTGREAWRVRVRHYRVIYAVSSSEVTLTVIRIGQKAESDVANDFGI